MKISETIQSKEFTRESLSAEAQLGGSTAGREHCERQRDVDQRIAEGGGRLPQPQEPELALLQGSQPAHAPTIAAYPIPAPFRFCLAAGMQRKEHVPEASIRQGQ